MPKCFFNILALCRFGIYVGADIDILRILRIILYIIIYLIRVSAFCGRIGNRVKIPNGAAAVSVEGAHIGFVKPATAIFSWEGASVSLMRKSEDLLG